MSNSFVFHDQMGFTDRGVITQPLQRLRMYIYFLKLRLKVLPHLRVCLVDVMQIRLFLIICRILVTILKRNTHKWIRHVKENCLYTCCRSKVVKTLLAADSRFPETLRLPFIASHN